MLCPDVVLLRRSDEASTSGQLVIASRESQYKILHFHHAGLDKLAEVFQQWKCCRETQLKDQVSSKLPSSFIYYPPCAAPTLMLTRSRYPPGIR